MVYNSYFFPLFLSFLSFSPSKENLHPHRLLVRQLQTSFHSTSSGSLPLTLLPYNILRVSIPWEKKNITSHLISPLRPSDRHHGTNSPLLHSSHHRSLHRRGDQRPTGRVRALRRLLHPTTNPPRPPRSPSPSSQGGPSSSDARLHQPSPARELRSSLRRGSLDGNEQRDLGGERTKGEAGCETSCGTSSGIGTREEEEGVLGREEGESGARGASSAWGGSDGG